jgi:hypothetical protein
MEHRQGYLALLACVLVLWVAAAFMLRARDA